MDGSREQRTLDGEELLDFVTQLELIKRESKDPELIDSFLNQFHTMKECSSLVAGMKAYGVVLPHQIDLSSAVTTRGLTAASKLRDRMESFRHDGKSWLNRIRNDYPSILLFGVDEVAEIFKLLSEEEGTPNPTKQQLRRLEDTLMPVLGATHATTKQLTRALHQTLPTIRDTILTTSTEWVEATARSIDLVWTTIAQSVKKHKRRVPNTNHIDLKSCLVLHKVTREDNSEAKAVHGVLQSIYKV